MASIYIPKTIVELIALSEKIIEKHYLENNKSPLKDINIAVFKVELDKIKEKYNRYLDLKNESEHIKEEIQLALGVHKTHASIAPDTIRFLIVQIRDILKGINRDQISELVNWGYVISGKDNN